MTSRLGYVGELDGAKFPLKYMAMFVVFDQSLLPHIAEFSNQLHIDVRFHNLPTNWLLSIRQPHMTAHSLLAMKDVCM